MAALLFLAFIVVPIVEITVIGQVQQALGWPITITILVLDSLIGAYLVRRQGALAWRRFRDALSQARMPTTEAADGALIVFGGALMLTPGFVTDIVGLACVLPPTRRVLNRMLRDRVQVGGGPLGMLLGRGRPPGPAKGGQPQRPPMSRPPPGSPDVIDVEVLDVRRNGDDGGSSDIGG